MPPRQKLTRCRIFNTKNTRKCLAAGLRPDPLRELKRSPTPLAAKNGESEGKGKGRKGRENGEGMGKVEWKEEKGKRKEGEGAP